MKNLLPVLWLAVSQALYPPTAHAASRNDLAPNARHTYEFGACEQQLMWLRNNHVLLDFIGISEFWCSQVISRPSLRRNYLQIPSNIESWLT